jgi:hypothetical protein
VAKRRRELISVWVRFIIRMGPIHHPYGSDSSSVWVRFIIRMGPIHHPYGSNSSSVWVQFAPMCGLRGRTLRPSRSVPEEGTAPPIDEMCTS